MEQKTMFLRLPSTSSLLCFILFFMGFVGLVKTFQLSNETDREALLAIKAMISGDPLGALSSWNDSVHFCNWQGVICGLRHQRVTILNMSSMGLVGSVSPHIGNLTFTRIIYLDDNNFHGIIPQETGRLFRLRFIGFANNSFQGEFPTNLTRCPILKYIFAANNNFGVEIPIALSSMSNLLMLDLGYNHFTGTVPPSFGNLSSIQTLALRYNNLDGSIPSELGQLSNLEFLDLGFNNVSGTVPTSLYNISTISILSFSGNQLHGMLPPTLGVTLPKLVGLYVAINQFYGPIPISLANASGLQLIDLDLNAFTGPIPMNLGKLSGLDILSAPDNAFGTNGGGNELRNFLTSISNCSNLRILILTSNDFTGSLPHSIANLSTKLTTLRLNKNYISGSIPHGIENLASISSLQLAENSLEGSIPDSMGKLSQLEQLNISTNSISGNIPSSLGNLSLLYILSLSYNMLNGSIPLSLSNCTKLMTIDLAYNNLTSAIPEQIFGLFLINYFSVSQNYLTGQLPLEIGNLKNLEVLKLSKNNLFGEIPITLGSCQVLQSLYMQGNLFKGTIPSSLAQLKGMQVLDLSCNNLSGQIPSFLGEFTSIQYLNLSYNMFEGEVPSEGAFGNRSAFSVVGNNKLCGGITYLQLPACPAKVVEKRKKSFSRRVLIPLISTMFVVFVLLLFCLSVVVYQVKRSMQPPSSISTLQGDFPKLSYSDLLQATNEFSSNNLIGEGSHGSVFKGILNSGEQIVAVKVLNLRQRAANKSFVAECEALRTIRHRNLVKIITSCSSIDYKGEDFKALVFEFMENGSLESWLHPRVIEQQDPKILNLGQRLNMAIDVASALDYLHYHCEPTIIHCDLKPSNVLLDADFCAHVGDFGLSRFLSATTSRSNPLSSIGIRGTVGYVAPEYGMGAEVSTQGDMYSYGVLLLEMFTGKRPTDNMFIDNISLCSYAKMSVPDKVMDVVDPRIVVDVEEEEEEEEEEDPSKMEACLVSVLRIGISCCAELPSERMNARDVLVELNRIRNVLLGRRNYGHQGHGMGGTMMQN
ncbi:probable LRR receptor-like serine/threonine-protein kinase At3g47570 [Actinidia eriantha]|uniref:probable LRR receptor-like serine/threonine-protein kinase At3g47570 n=1 Tax=Actinidia eriantha TaxID=165200 RepID=UPI00258C8865|nr:probable LRR receptor-like serine/threonine-protein kinase At3g47570 [Actinidia eriantha]